VKSFKEKRLRVTLILADANSVFPGTNSNTLIIDDLRISSQVQAVARLATQAQIDIFGMFPADMDALTIAWSQAPVILDNIVILEADCGNGFVQVFRGTIIEAQPIYSAAPDVFFSVLATTGYFQKINAAEPTSYPAAADIDTIAAGFAADMGFAFVNGGAFGTLAEGAYFWGSKWDQFAQACAATNTDFYVLGDTLLITAANLPNDQQPAVVLTPASGLVGYPQFERSGLSVLALFDPALTCGVPLEIEGDVPAANGRWYPYALIYVLESRKPNGNWFAQMKCNKVLV
jgi:hypothetical protein